MSQLDDWVNEDRHPISGPPQKKFRLDSFVDPLLRQMHPPGAQSPPPVPSVRTPPGGQGSAASHGFADPLTPPELLANAKTAAEIQQAELIARNRAAALLRREQMMGLNKDTIPPVTSVRVQYL